VQIKCLHFAYNELAMRWYSNAPGFRQQAINSNKETIEDIRVHTEELHEEAGDKNVGKRSIIFHYPHSDKSIFHQFPFGT